MAAKKFSLTSNQLKLVALIAMTCDHIGLMLLPQNVLLRVIGRLAFPIFACMIAEGCRHTSHRARYLGTVFGIGVLCQIFFYFAMGSFYQRILITFSLSISLIYLLRWARERGGWRWAVFGCALLVTLFLCHGMPLLLPGTDFGIDYGFAGVLLPLLVYCAETRGQKLGAAAAGLALEAVYLGGIQWFSLAALPLLALYRGERGSRKLKYFFYIYYPAHLVALWAIGRLIGA